MPISNPSDHVSALVLVIAVIVISLFFAFTNGIHDASSIVATPIACEAMTPRAAVVYASIIGFAGAVLGGSAVAHTVGSVITPTTDRATILILLAAVLAATIWNLVTWRLHLPSSSTHSLIGGMIGAAISAGGTGSVFWGWEGFIGPEHHLAGIAKVLVFLILSILIGLGLGYLVQKLSSLMLRNATKKANKPIRRVQLLTAAILAFGHGSNDTQKQMGIIVLALVAGGYATASEGIPLWVRLAAGAMMAVGTLGGGWSIMRTLGRGIFRLEPIHSVCSQIASSSSLVASTVAGAPVSSTQVVASSIMGVGVAENAKMVQWSVGREILVAFLVTIPAAMALSALLYYLMAWA
jgi:PiT family inorganic phosphate transporter